MKCAKCYKHIDNDSKYCPYCGVEVLSKKQKQKKSLFYSKEYEDNEFCDKSRNLFIIGFFAFDLVLSTIVALFQIPNIWVYGLSAILYIAAVVYGCKGIGFSLKLKKEGKIASGFVSSLILVGTSAVILVINMTSVMQIL